MREWLSTELDYYIENEIDYLKREEEVCGFDKDRFSDLLILETLNDKHKEEIINKVIGDENLSQVINETLRYYLYHR